MLVRERYALVFFGRRFRHLRPLEQACILSRLDCPPDAEPLLILDAFEPDNSAAIETIVDAVVFV